MWFSTILVCSGNLLCFSPCFFGRIGIRLSDKAWESKEKGEAGGELESYIS